VLSLDGIGAFDHVKRAAFFKKLLACEELNDLLPLVSALYGTQSRFVWRDDVGNEHIIEQMEGGEQGCPLMPALFALAQHDALVQASGNMLPDELLFSFLDDLYVVTSRARAYEAFQEVATQVETHAGVKTHMGKLKAWCRGGGPAPDDLAEACPDAWTADSPDVDNGLVVLGTPMGTKAFVEQQANDRIEKEKRLLKELPLLKDVQAAWVLLCQSAVPRANHTIRVLPPSLSQKYATAHDEALWQTFCEIMGAVEFQHDAMAQAVATLPGGLGGLGLRSAARTAQAAYWASWVDALPVLASKAPAVAGRALDALSQASSPVVSCLEEAEASRQALLEMGAAQIPSWHEAVTGIDAPPRDPDISDDDFARGWQCFASSVRETFFAERVIMATADDSRRALLLSQGGSGAAWLRAVPSEPVFRIEPTRFQVAMRRRLRWPLPLSGGPCKGKSCRHKLDRHGDHAASCAVSGLLKLRSRPVEKILMRVLREGGVRVRENVLL
jgi:hypothetical protein